MPCRSVRVAGVGAIVCSRREPRRRCASCKVRWATLLCDHPAPKRKSKTCDRPLCDRCAVVVGEDRHHCPVHKQGALL